MEMEQIGILMVVLIFIVVILDQKVLLLEIQRKQIYLQLGVAVPIPKFPIIFPPLSGRYELKAVVLALIVSYKDKSNDIVFVVLVNGALNVNVAFSPENNVVKADVVV